MKAASQPDTPAAPREGYDPARLIQQHQAGVWRYLRALGCEPAEADDLTQETFLAVLRSDFQQYSETATAAYLRKVAYNFLVSVRRRAGKVNSVENVDEFDVAWRDWMRSDNGEHRLDALRECLEQLTKRARLALELRFRDNESRANIAAALQITEHGAKNLMQRAKQQLRTCIEGKVE